MARLDDQTGKYLVLDFLQGPAVTDREIEAPLLPMRIAVADGIHAWAADVAALTAAEVHALGNACTEVTEGHPGGVLATGQMEFGIAPQWIVVTFDAPLIPPAESHRVTYQVSFHPAPDSYRRFGEALLAELDVLGERDR